jgi:hypothetical protein
MRPQFFVLRVTTPTHEQAVTAVRSTVVREGNSTQHCRAFGWLSPSDGGANGFADLPTLKALLSDHPHGRTGPVASWLSKMAIRIKISIVDNNQANYSRPVLRKQLTFLRALGQLLLTRKRHFALQQNRCKRRPLRSISRSSRSLRTR